MGKYLLMLGLVGLITCTSKTPLQQNNSITGVWQVESKFYAATYKIEQHQRSLQAQVLFYDDGTTRYQYQQGKKHFLFENLKRKKKSKKELYLDGNSGATKKEGNTHKISSKFKLKPISPDILEVTSYVMQQPLTEHWVRKK